MSFAFHYNSGQEPPLVIYVAHEDTSQDRHWRPVASIGFTSALRTSGFLMAIGVEEFQSLLLLLSFLSPDGRCTASVPQLAEALRLSQGKTRARFIRLAGVRWQEQPIVFHTRWASGLHSFSPAPGFIPFIEEPIEGKPMPAITTVPREVVIEHSRRTYARTRAQVEQEIEEMMDWRKKKGEHVPAPKLSLVEQKLRNELIAVGLLPEQADDLRKRFDALRIRRQLAWLPLRQAKSKAGYLIAAIKDDYAAPRTMGPAAKSKKEGGDGGA